MSGTDFDREIFVWAFIGTNRTGKSATAAVFGNIWANANPGCIVAGYDPQHRFKHLIDPRYRLSMGERGWWEGTEERRKMGRRPICELRNALMIWDDMRGLNKNNQTMDDIMRFMEFRAEYGIDLILIVHQPQVILSAISAYVSRWYIYYTKGKNSKFEDKIDNYEECVLAAQIMKDYVADYPSVMSHHKQFFDTTNQGKHRFPHIIVDTDTATIIPQNINQGWLAKRLEHYKANPPKF